MPWLAWAVVRTFGLERGPLIPLITFTPYMGLLSFLPLLVALILRRWAVAAAAFAVVVAFAFALLPRAIPAGQPEVDGGVEVRVMASNLFNGRGDPRTIVDLVRQERIDILALEELTPEEVGRLERAGLRRLLPNGVFDRAQGGASGSGLYTRWPLRQLPSVNPQPTQGEPRGLIQVAGARPIDLQVIHPLPPLNDAWRPRWAAVLDALPRPDTRAESMALLAGDFNATLDHARLRRLLGGDDGYVDAADATGKGYATTWPAGRHFPPEITIDHVLADPRVRVEDLTVHTIPGSDHRAVVAVLKVPRAAR
jgi:endonuclease/exonuclease/phosphatase family metal-dependent hydrolase